MEFDCLFLPLTCKEMLEKFVMKKLEKTKIFMIQLANFKYQ